MTRKRPLPPKAGPQPLAGHPGVLVEWRWTEPDGFTGDSPAAPRLVYRRIVVHDGLTDDLRHDLHLLRMRGFPTPPLLGDELPAPPGSTRRGIPPDYPGDDDRLCNARCVTGRPCRALALPNGRCARHGGQSTGPKTVEGKARCAQNLARWLEAQRRPR